MRPTAARLAICVTLLSLALVHPAHADDVIQQTNYTEVEDDDRPSIFSHGWQGLMAGAVTGLAGGYLFARRDNFERSDWRALGLGIGIGSLTGAALGISLGFVDMGGAPGGRYIARDLMAGAGFGAAVGAISGGISAAVKDDAEHILAGAAIGTLAGAGLGIITGIVQGQMHGRERMAYGKGLRLQPSLAYSRDRGQNTFVPGVAGRF